MISTKIGVEEESLKMIKKENVILSQEKMNSKLNLKKGEIFNAVNMTSM